MELIIPHPKNVIRPVKEPGVTYYNAKDDLTRDKSSGGFKFSWWQRSLIDEMLDMHLPVERVGEAMGVSKDTIIRYVSKFREPCDFVKVKKVSAEYRKNETIRRMLSVDVSKISNRDYVKRNRFLTRCMVTRWYDVIDPYHKLGSTTYLEKSAYQIDHCISIYDGFNRFKDRVPFKIIGHPMNLQVITNEENNRKGINSSITPKELMQRIDIFNKSCDPFTDFPIPRNHVSQPRNTYIR